jgi:hypothetical protein
MTPLHMISHMARLSRDPLGINFFSTDTNTYHTISVPCFAPVIFLFLAPVLFSINICHTGKR